MSTNEIPSERPRIKVVFGGFLVTQIRDGETAVIGALPGSACHRPIVHVYRIRSGSNTSEEITGLGIVVDQNFSLTVTPESTGIEVFRTDNEYFNRLDDENDKKDFRWFLDFHQVHRIPVQVNVDRLHPTFTINQGLIHVSGLADGEVRLVRQESSTRFGRFGLEITARVDFDPAIAAAVLTNGPTQILPRPDDEAYAHRYEVHFDCTCRMPDEEESDFGLIYSTMAVTKVGGEPIRVPDQVSLDTIITRALTGRELAVLKSGVPNATVLCTPEVYCSGGNG